MSIVWQSIVLITERSNGVLGIAIVRRTNNHVRISICLVSLRWLLIDIVLFHLRSWSIILTLLKTTLIIIDPRYCTRLVLSSHLSIRVLLFISLSYLWIWVVALCLKNSVHSLDEVSSFTYRGVDVHWLMGDCVHFLRHLLSALLLV